jgi:hypothetical protein
VFQQATAAASTLGALAIAERSGAMTNVAQQTGGDETAIRPFRVNFPEAELVDLRRRIDDQMA